MTGVLQYIERISIHPPRKGRDALRAGIAESVRNFNPPSPQGEGLTSKIVPDTATRFQSTLPARGGTPSPTSWSRWSGNFNPPSPQGEGQQKYTKILFDFMHFRQTLSHFSSSHPVFRERIKKQAENLSKSQCEGLREILGASPSHRSIPSGSRRDRSRVSPHNG